MVFDEGNCCRCGVATVAHRSGDLLNLISDLDNQLPAAAQILRQLASKPRARYRTGALCTAAGLPELKAACARKILNALARFGIVNCINRTWGIATSQYLAESLAEQLFGAAVYAELLLQNGNSCRKMEKRVCFYARTGSAAA